MRPIKFFIVWILCLIFNHVNGQKTSCDLKNVIKNTLLEDIPYRQVNDNTINLKKTLSENMSGFLGFIGENKKRLEITFSSIDVAQDDNTCYPVKGYTTVMNKNMRKFEGEFNLVNHFIFTRPVFENHADKYGFSVLEYTLLENKEQSSTGVFKGLTIILWKLDLLDGQVVYDDIFDGYDGSRNYQFFGLWTSYKTDKSSICCWGLDRIPCSGDLDTGAGEFSPNPIYYQFGWKN